MRISHTAWDILQQKPETLRNQKPVTVLGHIAGLTLYHSSNAAGTSGTAGQCASACQTSRRLVAFGQPETAELD